MMRKEKTHEISRFMGRGPSRLQQKLAPQPIKIARFIGVEENLLVNGLSKPYFS